MLLLPGAVRATDLMPACRRQVRLRKFRVRGSKAMFRCAALRRSFHSQAGQTDRTKPTRWRSEWRLQNSGFGPESDEVRDTSLRPKRFSTDVSRFTKGFPILYHSGNLPVPMSELGRISVWNRSIFLEAN